MESADTTRSKQEIEKFFKDLMEKVILKNRKGQRIVGLYESSGSLNKLAFFVPGLGGNKNEEHIKIARQVFLKNGFNMFVFDPGNTGESDGSYQEITVTGYIEDLEDVLTWAEGQSWFKKPFYLAGHSLGGLTIGVFAEKYPEKVSGLVLLASVISGRLSCETDFYKDKIEKWQKTGSLENDVGETLPWNHMADRLKYDLVSEASRLEMPVLAVVGSLDRNCPVEHQKILFDAIPGNRKDLRVIEGAEHCYEDRMVEFGTALDGGIRKLLKCGK